MRVGISNANEQEWMEAVNEGLKDLYVYKNKLFKDAKGMYTTGDPIKDKEILNYRYSTRTAIDFVALKVSKIQAIVGKDRIDTHGAFIFGVDNWKKIQNVDDQTLEAADILPEFVEDHPKIFFDDEGNPRTIEGLRLYIKRKLSEKR